MSVLLDNIKALGAETLPQITALSGESVVVLLFGQQLLANLNNWLDKAENAADTISQSDALEIEDIVSNAYYQLMRPLIGIIMPYATADAPLGTLPCDGSTYLREDFPLLYAALDAVFIVNADEFVTPLIQPGNTIIQSGISPTTGALFDMGTVGGQENHTMNEAELVPHTHTDLGHQHTYQPPGATIVAVAPGEAPVLIPSLLPSLTGVASANIQSTGLGEPLPTMSPYTALKYCIGAG